MWRTASPRSTRPLGCKVLESRPLTESAMLLAAGMLRKTGSDQADSLRRLETYLAGLGVEHVEQIEALEGDADVAQQHAIGLIGVVNGDVANSDRQLVVPAHLAGLNEDRRAAPDHAVDNAGALHDDGRL